MDTADFQRELIRDLGSLANDPYGFVRYAFPWGAGELEMFRGPDAWQADILKDVGARILTAREALQIAVASGHGIGKTALVAWLILWSICTFPDARGVVTANTDTQLRTKTWPELAKWYRLFIGRDFFELTATALFAKQQGHDKTWRCDLMPWSERNPEAFAGLHNKGRRILLVFDEASAIVPQIWETAQGALTDADTQILWAAFGNPTRNSGYFRECFGRYRHRWLTRQIDSRTAAMSNKAQIANWVEDYGEDSDLVRIRVRGVFPRTGSTQFISEEAISDAQTRPLEQDAGAPLVMGVDVARFGDDLSVIRFRRGRDARTLPALKYRELDTMQLASRVIEQLEVHPDIVAIFIDGNGVGGGVVDRVSALLGRRTDITLFEVQAGGKADSSNDYLNKRAECWGRMREWLKVGVIDADPQLRDDLGGVEYGFDAKNRIQLERKEDMKSRGLASPDNGDTLALTFAETVPRRDISKPKPKITPRYIAQGEGSWMT
jgi:hypothetical protein